MVGFIQSQPHTPLVHNYETEGNNSRAAASALTSGTAITGSLVGGSSTEVDYYSITASGNGLLSVSFTDTDTSGADSYDHYMVLETSGMILPLIITAPQALWRPASRQAPTM